MKPLTKRQSEILKIIRTFIGKHGYSPTLREIGALANLSSTNATIDHLDRLESKGYLRRGRGARTVVLLGGGGDATPISGTTAETDLLRRWVALAAREGVSGADELVDATVRHLEEQGR